MKLASWVVIPDNLDVQSSKVCIDVAVSKDLLRTCLSKFKRVKFKFIMTIHQLWAMQVSRSCANDQSRYIVHSAHSGLVSIIFIIY